MKVIFLGTPDFSVDTLKAIIGSRHEVIAVVTQPDKPVGRSGKPVFSPVKKVALEKGIKVLQYNKIRLEGVEDLKALNADIMVTCAFGQILSQEIIDIAPHGIINVHASLLPKYRGAAPIQWAIINGDKETGVTIMQTEAGVDTGDIISVQKTEIYREETAGELFDRLAKIGADLLVRTLDDIEEGKATFKKQDERFMSHVKMLKKEDGIIDFNNSSENIYNFVRGMNPWPVAYFILDKKTYKVYKSEPITDSEILENLRSSGDVILPGTICCAECKKGLVVATKDGFIRLTEIQSEGGKHMSCRDFLLGHKMPVGEII